MTTPSDHGIAVTRSDSGDLSWDSGDLPAVAEVHLPIGRGVRAQVDAAVPSVLLSWQVDGDADPTSLADAIGDPALVAAIVLARAGEPIRVGPLRLTEPWTRMALTAAVSQWNPYPIAESALVLDEAAAHEQVGDTLAAARLVALTVPALEDLARLSLDGHLGGGAAAELAAVAASAASAVRGTRWRSTIDDLAERLGAESAFGDSEFDHWLSSLSASTAGAAAGGMSMGASSAGTVDNLDIAFGTLDPHTVPARVFDWQELGREVIAERRENGDVFVSARLAAHMDPDAVEPRHFLAYAADRETGRIRDTAPMAIDGRTLVGVLDVDDTALAEVTFGIFHADTDFRSLRPTPLGRVLVEVDRLMIAAWNRQRTALAILHRVDATAGDDALDRAREESSAMLAAARRAAGDAHTLLTENIDRLPDDAGPVVDLLVARRDAIQRYRVALRRPTTPDGGTHPLLSELLPVEPWDEV